MRRASVGVQWIVWRRVAGKVSLAALVLAVILSRPALALEDLVGRSLPEGEFPDDTRRGPLRVERGDFNLRPATSPEAWRERAAEVRRALAVASGLWPMPTRAPIRARIDGRIDEPDYTVERVRFESLPGLRVSGNLYRPRDGAVGRRPGVLSPHGHFPGGRLQDLGTEAARSAIESGAETFEAAARSFMQARCVGLARRGCVVFHFDMFGYGDSTQLAQDLVHRFPGTRRTHRSPPATGFYSAAAEARLLNPLGLHTFQSIRALDFLSSLPDVDPERIAVTGGSGGGTQTFMLCALDGRPHVSVPAVIVSTTRQGGCTCENVSGLRIGTYNLEFTALFAPKPLLLISADDDTRSMSERGFPELARHYAALGAPENVAHAAFLQFPHNYNSVSRAAMYGWLSRHLGLGPRALEPETPFRFLSRDELGVGEAEPPPSVGTVESRTLDWLAHDSDRQLAALAPRDAPTRAAYLEVVGGAWDVLIRPGAPRERAQSLRFEETRSTIARGARQRVGLLRYATSEGHRAELPVLALEPSGRSHGHVVWIDARGKSGLLDERGSPRADLVALVAQGLTVIGVDLLEQGEFLPDGVPGSRQRALEGEEGHAGWTYCYNLPLFARRVHDVLAVVDWARSRGDSGTPVELVGLAGAGHWVAAAAALARGAVNRAVLDTDGFRFARLDDVYAADFLPGAVKYGDLPALLALAAPTRVCVVGGETDSTLALARSSYIAAGAESALSVAGGDRETVRERALGALLRRSVRAEDGRPDDRGGE